MDGKTKVLLLGGTSHTGKSTTANRLAMELGWRHLSTDQLARHPGRPWRDDGSTLPADVIEHFSSHSSSELLEHVLAHYRTNVWPIVEAVVRSHLNNPFDPSLILEGSAVLPDLYERAKLPATCAAAWLTVNNQELRERIFASSQFETKRPDERQLIEAFLGRSLQFNSLVVDAAAAREYPCVSSGSAASADFLQELVVRGGAGAV